MTFETMNIRLEDVPQLAEYAMLDGSTATNPRPLALDDFVDLYERGFNRT